MFCAKYGTVIDSRLGYIDWRRTKARWIQKASCIPKEWTAANNFIHEVAFWFDGTALYEFHGTKVGLLSVEMCFDLK